MVKQEDFESKVDYTTVLNNFEGPLDLLLHLIEEAQIEIEDIFVSEVTEQFLQYMQGLPYIDVYKVADYLDFAATILRIKAKSLVPDLDATEDEAQEEDDSDEARIIQALKEYRLIKAEMDKLKELETIGYYFKEPDKDVGETKTVFSLEGLTLDGLVAAFSQLLLKRESRIASEEAREIPRDEFTVEEKITYILESLEEQQEVRFEDLFTGYAKSEVITTFQAMLELLKHQYLRVKQTEEFGEITISLNPDRKEDEDLGQIDEYN